LTIEVLDDINPIPIKYSKYAMSLDKVFKHKSLEALHYRLKHHRENTFKEFQYKSDVKYEDPLYFIILNI